jgi:biopolymer transport protein TolQ
MDTTTVEAVAVEGSTIADLSIVGLFLHADLIVKLVMLMLLAASFWSWTIIFEKMMRFARLRSQAEKFEDAFWSGGSLEDLYDRIGQRPDHPMAAVFAAAMSEWRRAVKRGVAIADEKLRAGLQQRIGQAMQVTLDRELERLGRYLGFLATVGSTAPFIGLFGTVWGIMNSFQQEHLARRRRPRHRGGALRHGRRTGGGDPRRGRLQQAVVGPRPLRQPARALLGRVPLAPVTPARREIVMNTSLEGRAGRGRRRYKPMSEINVTPMVDVMLVLLVIFMVAAPLLTVGVQVDLPKTEASEIRGEDEPLVVSVDAAGAVFLEDTEVPLEDLGPRLMAVAENNAEARVFVRGDRAIDYGRVMAVMGAINQAGFGNVALIAEMPTGPASE